MSQLDALGRPVVADDTLAKIREAFQAVPEGKRGALLLIGDTQTKKVRAHFAARTTDGNFKVAAGGGFDFTNHTPFVEVAVAWYW